MFNYPFAHRLRNQDNHQSFNGLWQYKILKGKNIASTQYEAFKHAVSTMTQPLEVPYTIESPHANTNHILQPNETLLMSLTFDVTLDKLERHFLYFGAVDQRCRIWLNDIEIGYHEDGYIPFELEVTHAIQDQGNLLILAIIDASDQGDLPWGKQKLKNGQIWYTPQSGIWQSCGLISYPNDFIQDFYTTYDATTQQISIYTQVTTPDEIKVVIKQPTLDGKEDENFLEKNYEILLETTSSVVSIDHPYLWSPTTPWLYPVDVYYKKDKITSYIGLRYLGQQVVNGIRKMTLNGKVVFQSGVLDQGYWQEGMYTATNQEFIDDLIMVKDMGFNMVRKHIKIEPYRWYYHCDRLGLFVWQDMVNGGNNYNPLIIQVAGFLNLFIKDSHYRLFGRRNQISRHYQMVHQEKVIENLRFFPSIVLWGLFNEGWGQFDALAAANKARTQDPTRWIDHASGWFDQKGFDFKSIHTYFKPIKLKADHRMLILSEFGGYSHPVKNHHDKKVFGYRKYQNLEEYQQAVLNLYDKEILPNRHLLSASCYTQLSDVQEEVNGIVTYDREVIKWDKTVLKELNQKLIK